MKNRREFLPCMEQFRAVAILLVVAGHVALSMDLPRGGRIGSVVFNVLSGGTIVFVFISGFLFYHIFSEGICYRKFLARKLKLVVFPYLILGAPLVVFLVLHRDPSYDGFFLPEDEGVWGEYVVPSLKYLVTGRFLQAYWYVPFFVLIVSLAPIFVYFGSLPFRVQFSVLCVLTALALVVHRPVWVMNPFHSLVYYIPVYLFGIVASKYRITLLGVVGYKHILLLIMLTLLCAIVQEIIGDNGSYFKEFFVWGGVDLQLVQKLLVCLALMSWLCRINYVSSAVVKRVSEASFSTYFIHPYLLMLFSPYVFQFGFSEPVAWLVFPVFLFVVIVLSLGVAALVKSVFPNKSRYVTGY